MVVSAARKAVLAASALAFVLPVAGQRIGDLRPPRYRVSPGRVSRAPLADFAADKETAAACRDLLHDGTMEAAARKLEKVHREHPGDLAAFAGWAQTHSNALAAEAARWQGDTSQEGRFKLAVLLFYQWSALARPAVGRSSDYDGLRRPVTMLSDLWRRQRVPLAGMMLLEIAEIAGGEVKVDRVAIRDDLVHALAGEEAYQQYKKAAKDGWRGAVPAAAETAAANRGPLQGVLKELRIVASGRWRQATNVGGKLVWGPWHDGGPDKAREADYVGRWVAALKAAS